MIKLTLRPLTFSHVEMPWITRVRRFHSPFIYGAGSRRVVNGRAALTPTSWASEVCTLESLVNVSLVCEDISLEDLENNTHPQLMSSLLTFLSSSRNQYLQDSVPHLETCCLKWSYGHAYLRRNAPFPKKTKTVQKNVQDTGHPDIKIRLVEVVGWCEMEYTVHTILAQVEGKAFWGAVALIFISFHLSKWVY